MTRLLAVIALVVPVALVAETPAKTIQGGVLDHIELFEAAVPAPGESTVVIRPFDASKANLGTGGEGGKQARQEEAKTIQHDGPTLLAESFVAEMKKQGGFKDAAIAAEGATLPEKALVVEGSFLTLDPGSRAKRYFAGFGAGKSSVEVSGTVKDASGRVLASFRQRRVGAMGMGGGDSLGKLKADSENIGEDIAKFLSKWAKGEKLD